MINIDKNIKTLYKTTNSSRINKNYIINIDDAVELDNSDIVYGSFKLNKILCSSDSLTFGECNFAMLQFQCAAAIGNIKGKKVTLKQNISGPVISGGAAVRYEAEVKLGSYIIDSCEITENKRYRTITAYDNMYKFQTDVSSWYESLKFPIIVKNMFISLCTYIGVSYIEPSFINGDIIIDKTISPEELQGITVLKCIAEINAGFFKADEEGKIRFVMLDSSSVTEELEVRNYSQLKKEDYRTMHFDRLIIRQEDGDIGVVTGTGNNAYVIEDNFLLYGKSSTELQPISDSIYNSICNISYIPYTAIQIGLPYLEPGDYVKYHTISGTFESFILTRTLTGTQILKDEIETKGTETTGETFGLSKDIIRLKGKANVLTRSIEKTTEKITDIEKNVETEALQTAEKFSWIIKNGTSGSDFELTDKMAELTAAIISLNGNVKVNGDMITDGAITSKKISVEDLAALNATIGGWLLNDNAIKSKNGTVELNSLESVIKFYSSVGKILAKLDNLGVRIYGTNETVRTFLDETSVRVYSSAGVQQLRLHEDGISVYDVDGVPLGHYDAGKLYASQEGELLGQIIRVVVDERCLGWAIAKKLNPTDSRYTTRLGYDRAEDLFYMYCNARFTRHTETDPYRTKKIVFNDSDNTFKVTVGCGAFEDTSYDITNEFEYTEDSNGNITQIYNRTLGKRMEIVYK